MARIPNRPKREPHEGAVFLTDVVADNARGRRQEKGHSQREVAERMTALGHPWTQATTSELERGDRGVNVDELAALALVLGATFEELLDPGGAKLDYGHPKGPMGGRAARSWLRSESRIEIVSVDADGVVHFRLSPVYRNEPITDTTAVPTAGKDDQR